MAAERMIPDFANAGSNSSMNYANGINWNANSAFMASNNISDGTKSILDSTDTYSSGSFMVDGLVNGINDNSWRVYSILDQMSQRAQQVVQEVNKIGSPSRVFMEYGRWMVEGLAIGLERNAHQAYSAVEDLAEGVKDPMTSLINGVSDAFNVSDIDPTIRPVVDLSNVQNGINRMDRMFGGSSFGIAAGINSDFRNSGLAANKNYNSKLDDLISAVNGQNTDGSKPVTITNNITVSGAENPEDYANRLARQLTMQIRMV